MEHQDLLSGFIRLHILHHAAEGELYGQWMIDELARHEPAGEVEEEPPENLDAILAQVLRAIAEDPDFMTPIKTFKRQLFERLKGETPDLKSLLVCYLAIEGLRSMNLFDSDVLSNDERQLLVSSLLEIAGSMSPMLP